MYNRRLLESKIREDVEIGVQLLIDGKSDEWMLENLIGCGENNFMYSRISLRASFKKLQMNDEIIRKLLSSKILEDKLIGCRFLKETKEHPNSFIKRWYEDAPESHRDEFKVDNKLPIIYEVFIDCEKTDEDLGIAYFKFEENSYLLVGGSACFCEKNWSNKLKVYD